MTKESGQDHGFAEDHLPMVETVGGRKIELYSWAYEHRLLKPLAKHLDLKPKSIFVGGCGFGRDVQAASRTFPDAHITAVSVGQIPGREVFAEVGDRLSFTETTILDYLKLIQESGQNPEFDLILLLNVLSRQLADPNVLILLSEMISSSAYLLETDDSKVYGNFGLLWTLGFDQIDIPREIQESVAFSSLWRKK